MKILLISYNKEEIPIPVKPLGLAYIADSLLKNNHEVRLLDLRFKENIRNEIENEILKFSPDFIGISIRNIDTGCFLEPNFYIPQVKQLIAIIRDYVRDIPIILGGAGFSLMPKEILEYCDAADFGIVGEGEIAFNKFLQAYSDKTSYENVPAIIYRNNGTLLLNPPQYNTNVERVNLNNFFDKNYFSSSFGSKTNRPNSEGILSKRGCVFKCNYCGTPNFDGKKIRCYDVKTVIDNMEKIQSNSPNKVIFEFVDNIVNYPTDHLEALCNEMIQRGNDFKWMCIATPELLNRKNVELMKRAGCISIEFGIESFSDKILKNMSKSFTKSEAENAFLLCNEFKIQALCDIMIGGPGENYDTILETFETIDKVNPSFVLFNYGIRIFPNTSICDIAKNEGQISKNEDLLAPKFYISKEIDSKSMELIENRLRSNPGRFYLCREIFRNKLEDCIKTARQTWRNIELDMDTTDCKEKAL